MKKERKEALLRIPIGIISWTIVELWGVLICVIILFQFLYSLFTGKRNKDLANFANIYVSFAYSTIRYISFTTNERPFPFNKLGKVKDNVDLKFQN